MLRFLFIFFLCLLSSFSAFSASAPDPVTGVRTSAEVQGICASYQSQKPSSTYNCAGMNCNAYSNTTLCGLFGINCAGTRAGQQIAIESRQAYKQAPWCDWFQLVACRSPDANNTADALKILVGLAARPRGFDCDTTTCIPDTQCTGQTGECNTALRSCLQEYCDNGSFDDDGGNEAVEQGCRTRLMFSNNTCTWNNHCQVCFTEAQINTIVQEEENNCVGCTPAKQTECDAGLRNCLAKRCNNGSVSAADLNACMATLIESSSFDAAGVNIFAGLSGQSWSNYCGACNLNTNGILAQVSASCPDPNCLCRVQQCLRNKIELKQINMPITAAHVQQCMASENCAGGGLPGAITPAVCASWGATIAPNNNNICCYNGGGCSGLQLGYAAGNPICVSAGCS